VERKLTARRNERGTSRPHLGKRAKMGEKGKHPATFKQKTSPVKDTNASQISEDHQEKEGEKEGDTPRIP